MIKLIFGALLGTALIVSTPATVSFSAVQGELSIQVAHAAEPDPHSISREAVIALVARYAKQYGVKEKSLLQTVLCEAQGNPDGSLDPLGQSGYYRDGVQEDSWGLAQINLPSWPAISKEQAQDPDFAINFMAEKFSTGDASKWSCYRLLKAAGKI